MSEEYKLNDMVLFEFDDNEFYVCKITDIVKYDKRLNMGKEVNFYVVRDIKDGISYSCVEASFIEKLPRRRTKAFREKLMLLKLEGIVL